MSNKELAQGENNRCKYFTPIIIISNNLIVNGFSSRIVISKAKIPDP